MSWFDVNASVQLFRSVLPAPDLSACLPTPPAGTTRVPIPAESDQGRERHFQRMVHVLLTFLAFSDKRRAQKKRANGWAPALRQPPAPEQLQRRDLRATCQAANEGTFPVWLAEDLDLLVRLAARTRRAILKGEANAAAWQAVLEQQMRRTWGTLDNTLAAWTPEECREAEEAGWRACWGRLFGRLAPANLVPGEPARAEEPRLWREAEPFLPLRARR